MTHGFGQDMTATMRPPPILSPNLHQTPHHSYITATSPYEHKYKQQITSANDT